MKKRTWFILLLSVSLFTVNTCSFLKEWKKYKDTSASKDISTLDQEVALLDNQYQFTIQELQYQNTVLEEKAGKTEQLLQRARQKTFLLEQKLNSLTTDFNKTGDTTQKPAYYDSLTSGIGEYIFQSWEKDSLCDQVINELKELNENKDSVIRLCQHGYLSIKTAFDESLEQGYHLSDQLNITNRKLRRARVQKRLVSAGLMVLSGAVTVSLLQNK